MCRSHLRRGLQKLFPDQKLSTIPVLKYRGVPGVKCNSVTGAGSFFNCEVVLNWASFQLLFQRFSTDMNRSNAFTFFSARMSVRKYPLAVTELSSLAGRSPI